MNYAEAVDYLFGLQKFGWKLGLERMQRLLAELGHPENSTRYVHVAGTNGKGSVATMLSSILNQAGFRVGLYTSPHLLDVRERIRVGGKKISKTQFVEMTTILQPFIDKLECTFFEAITALALKYFAENKVEIAVLEVGLGGRLDATNVVAPELCVITSISPDHTEHLGSSLHQIAGEKAGILKAGIPCVIGEMPAEAEESIISHAAETNSPIVKSGNVCQIAILAEALGGSKFHLRIDHFIDDQVEIPLAGRHQIYNATLAATTSYLLTQKGWHITKAALKAGLKNVNWPARLQIVSTSPFMILDVAHNLDSMKRLVDSLVAFFPHKQFVFVFGLLKDKNYKGIVKLIAPLAEAVIIVRPETPRALEKEILVREFTYYGVNVATEISVGQGILQAVATVNKNAIICVTGSHYIIGEAWREIKHLTGTDNMFKFQSIE